jgi:histidinol-phosphate/aromatic aminotransferase/cobyric acid decarboxylase-like protein
MEHITGKIGVIYPTFEEYPNRLSKQQIVPFYPDNKDLAYNVLDLQQFFSGKDIQALLLINPDNPSGNFIPLNDILHLASWCRERNIMLIVDESFVDFSDGFEENSLLHNELLEQFDNLVVMKSISKSYGVPGLRLGILASSNIELIQWIKKDISIWNINSFAEFYMQIFNKYASDYIKACHRFIKERNRFQKLLESIPYLRVIPSQANFFCCEVIDKYTSKELTIHLLADDDIMIKDCNSKNYLQGKNYIRLSVRSEEDNNKLINALRELQ